MSQRKYFQAVLKIALENRDHNGAVITQRNSQHHCKHKLHDFRFILDYI